MDLLIIGWNIFGYINTNIIKHHKSVKKIITILWVIGNRRNNIIFHNHKCNPLYVIELARNTFHNMIV